MKVAQIGYGYWGKNIARTLSKIPSIEFDTIFDVDPDRQHLASLDYPHIRKSSSLESIMQSDIDCVFIVTPPDTHFSIAYKALEANKHVFVEKPLTTSLKDAYTLLDFSQKRNKILFVDHVFLYSEPVKYLKRIIDNNELGEIVYINSRRINLGLFQYKVDVIWDLAIHDISIIDHLIGFDIKHVSVFKKPYKSFPHNAIANINLDLANDTTVGINVSWLSPVKVREMIIGGTKKMAIYDDTSDFEKVRIYDHGVILNEQTDTQTLHEKLVQYRMGDVFTPQLPQNDSLANSINHFFDCVKNNKQPLTGRESIINTIQALEMISKL